MDDNSIIDNILKIKIESLASKVGVTLNWEKNPHDSYQWDGESIACLNQNASNIIHDIAHYALASNDRRKLNDFGLGPGPDSGQYSSRIMSTKECNDDETLASALGIYWEKQLGLDWKSTSLYHSWNDGTVPSLETIWDSLEQSKAELLALV